MFRFKSNGSLPRLLAWAVFALSLICPAAKSAPVDFNRDIRPIFADHCYACHGPDENKRKAGLRLDDRASAFNELKSGERAIVPGDPAKSALIQRILTHDADEMMPPQKGGKPLSEHQIDLLQQWVKYGAVWQDHWSFIPPSRPPLPEVKNPSWIRNPIDAFILARLEKEGFDPNAEADKVTLLRRVTLDLTGLPPAIEEVDAFLSDPAPDAYERRVDRLLQSPHYGERMAQHWLDLARYADTSGYHFDGVRFMWLWRDWVIRGFNENKPFDSFTVEQLAGDLLPSPTQSQRLATGFVRNNMTNDEGGADPDEYLNKYVADRVNTLGAVWLGLTVGCAECHDHKYDPLRMKEFYQLYDFFHNVPEKGLDRIRTDNPPPRLPVPTPEQALKFVEADFTLRDAEKTLQDRSNELGETQEKWELETASKPPPLPTAEGLAAQLTFGGPLAAKSGQILNQGRFVSTNASLASPRFSDALQLEGQGHVEYPSLGLLQGTNPFSFGAWLNITNKDGCLLNQTGRDETRGFDLQLIDARFEFTLAGAAEESSIKVRAREQVPQKQWLYFFLNYDGRGKAEGVHLYVNGKRRDLEVKLDKLEGSFANRAPLQIGAKHGQRPFSGAIDDIRFFDRILPVDEIKRLEFHGFLPILLKSRGNRSPEERADLARYYRENHARDYLYAEAALAKARRVKDEFYSTIPTSLIMEEMQPPRETFFLVRGDFRNKGERVTAGTPAFLPPLPEGPTNRLALARWLVSREQPLTARVTVNRFWSMFFGNGIVKTVNDFGAQGEWPSHPELLDWLSVQFRDGGSFIAKSGTLPPNAVQAAPWDVKALLRLIVTSASYRQSAAISPAALEKDPYNRLLTRGPRLRLDAEFIRDNALAISGLLNRQIGGPSVKPYQPPGIWDGVDASYKQDTGGLLYRRGLYVFWRRSAHYPSFATFDAPNREVCTLLRQRTQTPLQSLVLMNDPVYIEAARGLAQRVLREEPENLQQRLVRAFRHALGRSPSTEEITLLIETYADQKRHFDEDPSRAGAFLNVGELKNPETAKPVDLAALTAVASVLLNLNETITR